jgi:hypothetical protein
MPPADARQHLNAILARDLAHNVKAMENAQARAITDRFLAMFTPQVAFFSNVRCAFGDSATRASTPLTTPTFDTGLIAIDGKRGGVLWIEDED